MKTFAKIFSAIEEFLVNLLTWKQRKADAQSLEIERHAYQIRVESRRQQQKIQQLENIVKDAQGTFEVVNGERKYTTDEHRKTFENDRHRKLGGMFLEQLKAVGLNATRTVNNNPKGDLYCAKVGGDTDEAKLQEAIANFKALYIPNNKKSSNKKGKNV